MDYVQAALDLGAPRAKKFEIGDIVFDSRVILKCMFGCNDYGLGHTCPYQKSPLSMEQYEAVFKKYSWGVIIGADDKNTSQRISYEVEKQAFKDGYYFAFSLSDCGLCPGGCAKCKDAPCRFPDKARPAFHSVGIDVFKTVRNLNLPLDVLLSADDPQHWYSAVFVE